MRNQYLEAGRIVGTHGVRGELRVEPWCDSAAFLAKLCNLYGERGAEKLKVVSSRVHKSLLLLQLEGVDTVEQADMLRGKILYLDRADVKLPKGQYFMQDMIGLTVLDADTGKRYGLLTEVMRTGANDVYQVTGEDKVNYLVPAIPDVVREVDIDAGVLKIRPLRGIFEDAD
ncbi:ribosome maturation factor RimM [Clostridium sp. D33t1_170424_F3]|uniref:ribosome maturation factor RimM n=1 Tax=Clostridium sp. D33t1_170424_F3 TaxID=2787099 RepID=UPI0018A9F60D|nr:ribosome maturation factor RimM [Clostridium sp. D33t1_170424_F3]